MNSETLHILLLCTYKSTYVLQLYTYVKKYYPNIRYSLFTQDNAKDYYTEKLPLEEGERIYSFGDHEYLCYAEAVKLPRFDIIHSLWMEHFWGEAAGVLRKKCGAWFCSVGGSDLYRESQNGFWRMLQRRIIKRSSWISSEGEETRDYFQTVYGKISREIPHTIIRFGVDILDSLARQENRDIEVLKEKYAVPQGKIVIMCGTNARAEHQHQQMLQAIAKLPRRILERICLLLPMTYGGTEEYIESISQKASEVTDSVVLREFLSTDEMAEIALITDILIHVQTTDQLNSAMLSQMYCGNVVIAGAWLPYRPLRDRGVEFISINTIDELTEQIPQIMEHIEEYRAKNASNREIVYDMSSWERSAGEWYTVYEKLADQNKEKVR